MQYVHDCRIDSCQQCDWCEDPCGLWGSIFFEGDKCQWQKQPRDNSLGVIEEIKMTGDGLAVCGAELADIVRDYDL